MSFVKQIVCLSLFLFWGVKTWAHDPNKAYFEFEEKEAIIEVVAELPWTIRASVMKEYPDLAASKSQQVFDETFFKYVKNNLVLYTSNNTILELLTVKHLPSEGHTHGGKYMFSYEKGNLLKVKNTFLLNTFRTSQNYHSVKLGENFYEFKTSKSAQEAIISHGIIQKANYLSWFLGVIVLLVGVSAVVDKRKLEVR